MSFTNLHATDTVVTSESTTVNKNRLMSAIDEIGVSEVVGDDSSFVYPAYDTVHITEQAILAKTKQLNAYDTVRVHDRANRSFDLSAADTIVLSETSSRADYVDDEVLVSETATIIGGPTAKDSVVVSEVATLGMTKQLKGQDTVQVSDAATIYNINKTKIYSPS